MYRVDRVHFSGIGGTAMVAGARLAIEAGCPQEADRLNERLSGIVLLWDQLRRALKDSDLMTHDRRSNEC